MYLTMAIIFAVIFFAVGCYIVKWMYRDTKSKNGRVNDGDVLGQMVGNVVISLVLGAMWPLTVPLAILGGLLYLFYYKWFRHWVKRD